MADRASSPHIEINFNTTLEDIIKATIFDDSPATPQPLTTSKNNISSSSQNDIDTSKAETRFDEFLASLISDQPTPEKSPDNELQLALKCLPPPIPQKNFSDNIISSNEIFSALQSIFRSEASSYTPSVLIKSIQPEMSTASRERQLLQRLDSLRPFHPQQMNDLTSFFKYQSAQVETDRYCALHQNSRQPHHIQESINQHYTIIHHRIMDRVESSLQFLEDNLPQQSSTINMTTTAQHQTCSQNNLRTRPSLSQKAVQLMEQWYYSHLDHPHPPSDVIQNLAVRGGIKEEQVKKWFSNKRNRSRRSLGISKRKTLSVNKCVPSEW
ncbi:uncharacterized protein LOC130047056 [Ostrea edulis]|uniref:uncharacterized protein LOC130047056 n=1 Tax=Ostrea edulis TaxID=37623 RepID=UPI0024AFC263|nr:uncharacterized protein LOC130047056 [Ostrea edulis]